MSETLFREVVKVRKIGVTAVVTLPVDLRKQINLQLGDRVIITVDGPNKLTLEKEVK